MDEMQSSASGTGTVPEDGERSVRRLSRGEFVAPPRDDSVPAPRPGGAGYRAVKRAFDLAFSLVVIAVLAVPVCF